MEMMIEMVICSRFTYVESVVYNIRQFIESDITRLDHAIYAYT